MNKLAAFFRAIKFSHSVFALPFAVAAAFLASEGLPSWVVMAKVVLAVVLARTAAMAFNRWADARIDARNPRTENREIPSGQLSRTFMGFSALFCALAFVGVATWLNRLAFVLSPVALTVLLGYSYTKRFTSLSHVVLGVALGLSPLGAWVAVRGELDWVPTVLGLAIVFWTAGFDIIYACQDREFDVRNGLHSIPARLGTERALRLTRYFHTIAVALLVCVGWLASLGLPYAIGVVCVAVILAYENSLVKPNDLSKVNVAFFTLNGLVSMVFMAAVIAQTVL
ncbi:MAG: putative 4-hydroxybenzoate polyprenyltransferase [Planctomycetes bacterium]|nr:putative 4-hydroxybenzoate polyprenyltransferase [Planctomycetota bacterium]